MKDELLLTTIDAELELLTTDVDVVKEHESSYGRDLLARTRDYSLEFVKFYSHLPSGRAVQHLGMQALRSGTSVGAHYREGRRARSTAEFISKIEVAIQELDEAAYWLELLAASGLARDTAVDRLLSETGELVRIFTASVKTAKLSRK